MCVRVRVNHLTRASLSLSLSQRWKLDEPTLLNLSSDMMNRSRTAAAAVTAISPQSGLEDICSALAMAITLAAKPRLTTFTRKVTKREEMRDAQNAPVYVWPVAEAQVSHGCDSDTVHHPLSIAVSLTSDARVSTCFPSPWSPAECIPDIPTYTCTSLSQTSSSVTPGFLLTL